jgi:acetyl-CoA carboxylase biotin carboxyl carrier protein
MDGNEMNELRELVEFLKASDIAEFDLEKEGLKVRLKFQSMIPEQAAPAVDMAQLARLMASAPAPIAPRQHVPADASAAPAAAPEVKYHVVKSPIVGTFYDAPSPGSPPFVKIGDTVEVGQVLCIVEAMKLMNEIESDAAGEIIDQIASGGQPVEYGQSLFSIKAR